MKSNKHPFTPELLDALPSELAGLFRALEEKLLEEICSRLKIAAQFNEVTVQDIRALRALGVDLEAIKRAIEENTGIAEKELNKLLDDVVERNQQYYTERIELAGLTAPDHSLDESDIDAIRKQTLGEFRNLTQSMGFMLSRGAKKTLVPPGDAYQWALDKAAVEIQSGAISYREAIESAVKELADSGTKSVSWESGHVDQTDVAVRRAVLTGVRQICQKYSEQLREELGTDLVEVTAHRGARDTGTGPANHKSWQGKVYQWREKAKEIKPEYEDFVAVTGYGTGPGLGGWNCLHQYDSFIEGEERTYSDEYMSKLDPPPFEYQGKTYTSYEATQQQRKIERTIRKLRREQTAYKASGAEKRYAAVTARMERLNKQYRDFSAAAGLRTDTDRIKVLY